MTAGAKSVIILKDVAEHAGVSVMTVSNVVNGKRSVSAATRAKVEASIRALGYRPNLSARSLARGRTGVMTLAVPEAGIPYFAELASAIMLAAASHSQTVVIEQTLWDRDRELALLSDARPLLSDALLVYPSTLSEDDIATVSTPIPVVFFGGSVAFRGADHIIIDNAAAARGATEHLIARGRRRIALIGPLLEPSSTKPNARVLGYREALESAGIPFDPALVMDAPAYHRRDGQRAMERLLDRGCDIDAVFCLSDLVAVGALKALSVRGIRVPDDVAVVGFDDIEEAEFTAPTLTSIRPDKPAIAAAAVRLANERIEDPDGERASVIVGEQLIVRESSAARR